MAIALFKPNKTFWLELELVCDWHLLIKYEGGGTIGCLGTGTGGTLMGVYKRLKEINPDIKIFVVEPDESPVMSGGSPGLHKIQGIGDGSKFLVDLKIVNRIIRIKSDDAIDKMKQLYKEGFFVGVSASANILASEIINKEFPDKIIVTFMCDRGDRYLSMI